MPSDQFISIAEAAHRFENIKVQVLQVTIMREDIAPDKLFQVEMVGTSPLLVVMICYRIEVLALSFDETVVFLVHLLQIQDAGVENDFAVGHAIAS